MIQRLRSHRNPNLVLLNYVVPTLRVANLLVVPKHFFIPDIIEARAPLAASARRAGWRGCNIVIDAIPSSGRIFVVKDSAIVPKPEVLARWKRTLFLSQADYAARSWLLSVMKIIESLNRREFTLSDLYTFESMLSRAYPENKHVKEKIRQQLQVLGDKGYLRFLGRGRYEVVP